VLLGLLAIWLVRGRIIVLPQGSTSASAHTGLAAHVIDVLRAHVDRSAARGSPAEPPLPASPGLPPDPALPPPPDVAAAGSASPGLTPPPGGWDYPPEVIYEVVERERRRQREREAAARRGPR
jgi:serine/threonine-protein kinase